MAGLLIAGTSSDAGKSLFVTGLCRVARRRGIDVAPFKAQNMSNNSMVCLDGSEIGRAQYLQAAAAGVVPESILNPVLLKPGTDRRSFVVLRGRPAGTLEAGEYATSRRHLAEAAYAAYEELAARHELVICEGAGSPAEINLRRGDYTNMGLARQFDLPVAVVGDIDRGGVLASLYGTWALVDDADRALLAGYVINKFRGDQAILDPGLDEITRRTGLANYGVLPYLHGVWIDGEDALEVGRWRGDGGQESDADLTVAAVRLPRISNATDVDALAQEPGVRVVVTVDPGEVERADLVVLPGTRSTLGDLDWLRRTGIADAIRRRAEQSRPVLGICGGFQMLARTIEDDVEGDGVASGLGLLPVDVRFHAEKVLGRPSGQWRERFVDGYTIHHGRPAVDPGHEPFLDGVRVGAVWGTMWHGSLENDDFRRAWLREIAAQAGRDWSPTSGAPGFGARRELMIETVADAIETHIDVDALLALGR
ncbi:MAG TPA: cobyric acid synthase [Arachnia sp.]|nr:cobyric acid synthase [Arachnia sp.]HMT86406.1 cobyric acid synthase [Arachnia sp.]